jgi:hypothetical protein
MTAVDRGAEYAATADAWRAFCQRNRADVDTRSLDGQPIAVVLLAALAEPPLHRDAFTGDLMADALGGLDAFIRHLEGDASEGGGGRAFLHGYEIDSLTRRVAVAITLRSYERASRERGGAR